ncbi:MAG TPA: FAD binding domain-containing protein [Candidatus Limnocylindrales bacterium]|nr:FAD binding domain-containing protein [Candidatus Limnocylindrales bacterium]
MRRFAYARPTDLAAAIALLAEHGPDARVLAGGTDLVIGLRNRVQAPAVVVDVKRVPELAPSIGEQDGALRISAGTTMTDLLESPRVARHFPALAEAASIVGSIQIRNRATLVGNQCNASPAADTAPPLLVYGAVLSIHGPTGERRLPLDQFFVRSGVTVLQYGELVTAVWLPLPEDRTGSAFRRRTRRRGHDLASVTLAVSVSEQGRTRLAFGSLGPRPLLFEHAGTGEPPLEQWFTRAQPSARSLRADPEYRLAMLRVLAGRALAAARERLDAA